jgi:chemotaxis protein methyltransferase CheR
VCKRISRRMVELGIAGLPVYERYLRRHPSEWRVLDSLCNVTISRFYRDRAVFDAIGGNVLPFLAEQAARRGDPEIRCWSIGCCRGEEAYSLQILWALRASPRSGKPIPLRVLATDCDRDLLRQAREGAFRVSSLKDLPANLRRDAFERAGDRFLLRAQFKERVEFLEQDIRTHTPPGLFHLILCRNLVLTYYGEALQRRVTAAILGKLVPDGVLVIGARESLPEGTVPLRPVAGTRGIYRKSERSRDKGWF